jgi:aspartyl-tRNA(Asn)/glutamyl-tRNA(Gln) amidotransferase subunit A
MELWQLTLKEARQGLEEKKFSSAELVKACIDRIKKVDKKVKAFITVCEEEAIRQAREADKNYQKLSLLGIPIAIKDNFCTKGIKTTAAAKVLENYFPPYEATVVRKLKEAGAVIIGKTNMDAWAHGSSTETSDFFTTRNPWDLERLPGGSSGGSAAAIAADLAVGAIGSETAGSIRQPAAWCGVVGLKPTYGRVSRYGLIAMASSLDCPGPMTKTTEDAKLIFEVICGKDEKDATSKENAERRMQNAELVIGVPKEYFLKEMQEEVKKKVGEAIMILEKLGFKIQAVSLLDPKYAIAAYTILQRAEVSSNLGRYDGIRYGNPRSSFGVEAKRRIMLGTYALSVGYYEAYYRQAQKVRSLICQDFAKVFRKVSLLAAPASPSVALPMGASQQSAMFGELQDVLFEASSLAGLPGLALPCGFSQRGLPIGMQLIGPRFSENLLLRVGQLYEQETGWYKIRPKI